MNFISQVLNDLISLVYPNLCYTCDGYLSREEDMICSKCLYQLPLTNYHKDENNEVAKLFWGRIHMSGATSLFFFHKGTKYQKMMHEFKYRGKKKIGYLLGKYFASQLTDTGWGKDVDAIVPVPLHPKKERKRGYNQSAQIAYGMAEILNTPVDENILIRHTFSSTQTKMNKEERWENVKSIFSCPQKQNLPYSHILIVDDIVTTGATIEACANELTKAGAEKISVATLAFSAQ
jgi:ComF family protein